MTRTAEFTVERRDFSAPRSATIALPLPPAIASGAFAARHYAAWREQAGRRLKAQKPLRFAGPVLMTLTLQHQVRSSELEARIRPVLDLLVLHHVIADGSNRFVQRIVAQWGDVKGALVELRAAESGPL